MVVAVKSSCRRLRGRGRAVDACDTGGARGDRQRRRHSIRSRRREKRQ